MSETIYREQNGGTPPGGSPPPTVTEDVARAAEALEHEKELDHDTSFGHVEHDIVGPNGDRSPMDHGRSTGCTKADQDG